MSSTTARDSFLRKTTAAPDNKMHSQWTRHRLRIFLEIHVQMLWTVLLQLADVGAVCRAIPCPPGSACQCYRKRDDIIHIHRPPRLILTCSSADLTLTLIKMNPVDMTGWCLNQRFCWMWNPGASSCWTRKHDSCRHAGGLKNSYTGGRL